MKLVYTGPSTTGVYLPINGVDVLVERGTPVDVPGELADSLLEQDDDWKTAPTEVASAGRRKDGE